MDRYGLCFMSNGLNGSHGLKVTQNVFLNEYNLLYLFKIQITIISFLIILNALKVFMSQLDLN